ncbi:hypothetical protein SUGI_0839150 [Cryptomeria japonica]|nr:hypothetical protein SUGI_0839150 [Cryptomeria japonica]
MLRLFTRSESGDGGLNGICKLEGDSSVCSCPLGFHYVDAKNTSKGCSQHAQQLNKCGATAEMRSIGHIL